MIALGIIKKLKKAIKLLINKKMERVLKTRFFEVEDNILEKDRAVYPTFTISFGKDFLYSSGVSEGELTFWIEDYNYKIDELIENLERIREYCGKLNEEYENENKE